MEEADTVSALASLSVAGDGQQRSANTQALGRPGVIAGWLVEDLYHSH